MLNNYRFVKIPNKYIRCDIQKEYGISNVFYIVYILILKHKSIYDDYSYIILQNVFDFYGFNFGKSSARNKPKLFYEIIDVLNYMVNENMIEIKQSLTKISLSTGIEIKIIPQNYYPSKNFTILTFDQLDAIYANTTQLRNGNILAVLLYILSYFDENNTSRKKNFWGSVKSMTETLSISRTTTDKCLQYLIEEHGDKPPILTKKYSGRKKVKKIEDKVTVKNETNVYTLNPAYGRYNKSKDQLFWDDDF